MLKDRITSTQGPDLSYLLLIRSAHRVALTSFDESIYKMAKQINYYLANIVCLIHKTFKAGGGNDERINNERNPWS